MRLEILGLRGKGIVQKAGFLMMQLFYTSIFISVYFTCVNC